MHRLCALITLIWSSLATIGMAGTESPPAARPWLGVAVEAAPQGVLIKEALAGTPSQAAGLQAGDVIEAIGDQVLKTPQELIKAVQNQGVGTTVVLKVRRGTELLSMAVKLVARPDELAMIKQQLEGKSAPGFDLKVIRGSAPGKLAALTGRVVIVEFWATWCPACRSTHPRLSDFAKQHQGQVAVLAISDEEERVLKAYADTLQADFTVLMDRGGQVSSAYRVAAIPELLVIDQTGKVAFATIGAGSYLDEALAAAAKLLPASTR